MLTPNKLITGNDISENDFLAQHPINEGNTDRPIVMLTYDDNGSYKQVQTILDAFNNHNVKATFFFIGEKIYSNSKAVRAIIAQGHLFGFHGWKHINYLNLTEEKINEHIEKCFDAISEIDSNYLVKFIRFPYGLGYKNIDLLRICGNWGLQHVYWTACSGGLDKQTYDNVVNNVRNGSIILSHMFRYYDVEYADRIVGTLIDNGYLLRTVEAGRKYSDRYELR